MAYQPKYAQKKPAREEKRNQPRQNPQPKQKKMSKGMFVVFLVLGIVIVPLSSFLTGKLLLAMARDLGRPKASAVKTMADLDIQGSFSERMEAQISGTRTALASSDKPDLPNQQI